jgi:CDP-paratose 2-epimerase
MMHILITGGAGFVGSNLAIKLKQKYPAYHITAFDNLKRRGSELNLTRLKENKVEFVHGDIRCPEDLFFEQPVDLIIDASAEPSVLAGINSPVQPVITNNLIGTVNCLELARKKNAAFIFLSTSRVYPIAALENASFAEEKTRFAWTDQQSIPGISSKGIAENFPLEGNRSFYGATKLASELLLQEYHAQYGMKMVINRFSIITGPWQMGKVDQGVVVLWVARHLFNGRLSYFGYGGQGKQVRDILHIDDAFRLVDWQIHNLDKVNGKTFNAGGGLENSLSLQEMTALCNEITGNKIAITSQPENRAADIRIYITDNRYVKKITGWSPAIRPHQIITDIAEWIQGNKKILEPVLS